MMTICRICLCTGQAGSVMLQTLEGPLRNFYDELCGKGTNFSDALYCPICAHLLEKFYNFRNKCLKAMCVLTEWNKQRFKLFPKSMLHTKVPPTSLGFCNNANRYIYCYNDDDSKGYKDLNISSSDKHIIIKPMDIKKESVSNTFTETNECNKALADTHEYDEALTEINTDIEYLDFEMLDSDITDTEIRAESDDKHFLVDLTEEKEKELNASQGFYDDGDKTNSHDVILIDDNRSEDNINSGVTNNDDINYNIHEDDDNINDDIDFSQDVEDDNADDEVTKILKRKLGYNLEVLLKEVFKTNLTNDEMLLIKCALFSTRQEIQAAIKEHDKELELAYDEMMRNNNLGRKRKKIMTMEEILSVELKSKLENGDVKDKDGNIIDVDIILNNLDKLTNMTYNKIKRNCAEGMDFDRVDSDDGDYSDDGRKDKLKGWYSKQHMPLDINKLKNDLKKKLSSFDEILAKDGTAIDKEVLLQNLGERVSYHDLRSLRAACRTGSKKLIEAIQGFYEKFQEDDKFQAVFDIQYLSTYEMKLEEFEKRKTYESYINAEFKCNICYTPFKRAKDLENHTKDHHEETPKNAGECCPICKVRPGKRQYKRNVHSSTHSAVYKCRLCNMVTYYRGTMRNHFAMHSGKMYNCAECDTSFKWQSSYFLHMSKYHRRKQHVCAACGRGFPSALALTAHSKKHQDDPPPESTEPVTCTECDVTFPSGAVFEAHTADVHMAPPPVRRGPRGDAASLPGYQFTGINTWRKPRAQQKKRPVKCILCNTVRLGAAWLKTHFKREHPNHDWNMLYANVKKHLCDICGSGFASVYVLRDHMNLHTGARPFPCDLCPKRFRSSMRMRDHRARHFPPTNLCTLCGKKFKSKSNLFNHMKVHTGEKSHKCVICGKGFQYSTTLNEHVRGVHHNIRRVRRRAHREKERVEEMALDHDTISQ